MRRIAETLCAALLAASLAGCASAPGGPRAAGSPGALAALAMPAAAGLETAPVPPAPAEVIALTPEMRRFVERAVARDTSEMRRTRALARAILSPGTLGVRYDAAGTRTAAETFRAQAGNCLSLSLLFAAMARELGIDATFQEVRVAPQWDRRGNTVFSTRHINVVGELGHAMDYEMDFYPELARGGIGRRPLTDAEAVGQYYNNMAAEHLAAGELASAYVYLVTAIEVAPRLDYAWTNLGVLYQRNGQMQAAEAALRHALRLDRRNTSAMSNLARLLRAGGDAEESSALVRRLQRLQRRNPYYQFALAEQAEHRGELDAALAHLDRAIELKPGERLFYDRAAAIARRAEDAERRSAYLAAATALGEAAESERRPGIRF